MDLLKALLKRVGTRHRPRQVIWQAHADGTYRAWDARHRGYEHGDGRSVWRGKVASGGSWSRGERPPVAGRPHGILGALQRYKVLLGLAALLLLLVAGVAVGAVALLAVLGLQLVGLLGHVEFAALLEVARIILAELLGMVGDLATVREQPA